MVTNIANSLPLTLFHFLAAGWSCGFWLLKTAMAVTLNFLHRKRVRRIESVMKNTRNVNNLLAKIFALVMNVFSFFFFFLGKMAKVFCCESSILFFACVFWCDAKCSHVPNEPFSLEKIEPSHGSGKLSKCIKTSDEKNMAIFQ